MTDDDSRTVADRAKANMERLGIPKGTDNPTLVALGATPLTDDSRTVAAVVMGPVTKESDEAWTHGYGTGPASCDIAQVAVEALGIPWDMPYEQFRRRLEMGERAEVAEQRLGIDHGRHANAHVEQARGWNAAIDHIRGEQ